MRLIYILLFAFVLGSCSAHKTNLIRVSASVETESVDKSGDAADDPAVWINVNDAENSLIFGSNKKHGIYSFNLDGHTQQFLPLGRINNIDVRQNVQIGDEIKDIISGSNRTTNKIEILEINEGIMQPSNVYVPDSGLSEVYGFCMGNIHGEHLIFIATGLNGNAELYELGSDSEHAELSLKTLLTINSKSEGCVIDDDNGDIYIAEEEVGIWRFNYSDPKVKEKVISVDNKYIYADIEGLALFNYSGNSYLIASSQSSNTYPVYNRDGYSYVKSIKVIGSEYIDGTSKTDGIEFTTQLSTKSFPKGIFIVQDDKNTKPEMNQNFKLISAKDIFDNF